MFLRTSRIAAASAAALLVFGAGCGSDDSGSNNSTDSSDTTVAKDSGSAKLSPAAQRLANAEMKCEDGVTMEMTMGGSPFMTMATDGTATMIDMSGGGMIEMMMGMFGGSTEDMGIDADVLEQVAADMATSVILLDDTVYTALFTDGEPSWYAVPRDEFEASDLDLDIDEMESMCDEGIADATDTDMTNVYEDPDDDNQLIAAGEDLGFDSDSDTSTTAVPTELTDDEIRELRDSDNRTIITFDGDRIVRVDAQMGMGEEMAMVMDISYGDVNIEAPADAQQVSGAEFATINEEHSAALDAKYAELFGMGAGDMSIDEDFDLGDLDMTEDDTVPAGAGN